MLMESGRRCGDARVINVASHQHMRGRNAWLFEAPATYDSWTAYGQSKLALVHFSSELQRRYADDFNLRSVALHPGPAYTNMICKGLADTPWLGGAHRLLAPLAVLVLLTPAHCAQTTIFCASDPHLQGGNYYERCAVATASDEARDADAARKLWEASESWLVTQTRRAARYNPGEWKADESNRSEPWQRGKQ